MLKKTIQTIDVLLKHLGLLLSLLLLIVLRVPNFSDPYWYGDEAIYLTIGQSIRAGKTLYTEIVDHKTPLIYYLATVPNQFWFRVLLTAWMIAITVFFYDILRRLLKSRLATFLGTIIFVLLTTLPTFEGHIPNGELFVMGFVIFGLWILVKSSYLSTCLDDTASRKDLIANTSKTALFAAGFAFGMGFLTKVPALLDFAALLFLGWLFYFRNVFKCKERVLKLKNAEKRDTTAFRRITKQAWLKIKNTVNSIFFKENLAATWQLLAHWSPIIIGFVAPVVLSILYFIMIGSGRDYLEFGLLYNLHYSQTWTHNFGSNLVNLLFTLPGKTAILTTLVLMLTLIERISLKTKFFAGWYLLTMYAVLLSNRPYPHYYLQATPPPSLLLSLIW